MKLDIFVIIMVLLAGVGLFKLVFNSINSIADDKLTYYTCKNTKRIDPNEKLPDVCDKIKCITNQSVD